MRGDDFRHTFRSDEPRAIHEKDQVLAEARERLKVSDQFMLFTIIDGEAKATGNIKMVDFPVFASMLSDSALELIIRYLGLVTDADDD